MCYGCHTKLQLHAEQKSVSKAEVSDWEINQLSRLLWLGATSEWLQTLLLKQLDPVVWPETKLRPSPQ